MTLYDSDTILEPAPQDGINRFRVAFLLDTFATGGTELNAVRTAERLSHYGIEVVVLALQRSGPLRERYREAGIPISDYQLSGFLRPSTLREARRAAQQIRTAGIRILHSHDVYTNIFASLIGWFTKPPVTIMSRRWFDEVPRQVLRRVNRTAYRSATHVLANSNAVADLVRAEGVPDTKVMVVPNFVEEEAFEPPPPATRDGFHQEHGLTPGHLIVGCVARLVPVKNQALLLRAIEPLTREHPSLAVVLIGDGESREALGDLAHALGIQDIVHFAGERQSRPNNHFHFDISVSCSTSEGSPNSVIEAMAAGRPVVATDVGGTADAVQDEVTGLLVPSSDVDAMRHALERLITDHGLRSTLGATGRSVAARDYSEDAVLTHLTGCYRACLHESDAATG